MKIGSSQTIDDGLQFKLSLFYFMLFLSIGCYLPYFSLWLKARGLDGDQSSIILAAPMIIRIFFTPIVSVWADFEGDYRKILIILTGGSLLAVMGLGFVDGFWPILIVASLNAIFGSSIIPLTETMAMIGVRVSQLRYGRARSFGSFSFIVGSLLAGVLVDYAGSEIVLPFLMLAGLGMVLAAVNLPRPQGRGRVRQAVAGGRLSLVGVRTLLKHRLFWVFLIGAGLGQGCHAFYYGFSSRIWQDFGYAGWLIGSLWTLGVVSEILLFLFFGDWLRSFNPSLLILCGAVAAILRWVIMGFDPHLVFVVFAQVLHAFSFGLAHLGTIYFINKAVPETLAATAQGMGATMSAGIFMGGAVLISGPLYDAVSSHGYFVMAGIAGAGLLISLLFYRLWDGELMMDEGKGS